MSFSKPTHAVGQQIDLLSLTLRACRQVHVLLEAHSEIDTAMGFPAHLLETGLWKVAV
jgi:hypothetical protein